MRILKTQEELSDLLSLPVIIDVDTGYGNPLTVWKIVNDLVAYGAAGIFLEDQIWPKDVAMRGKDVIEWMNISKKLRACSYSKRK